MLFPAEFSHSGPPARLPSSRYLGRSLRRPLSRGGRDALPSNLATSCSASAVIGCALHERSLTDVQRHQGCPGGAAPSAPASSPLPCPWSGVAALGFAWRSAVQTRTSLRSPHATAEVMNNPRQKPLRHTAARPCRAAAGAPASPCPPRMKRAGRTPKRRPRSHELIL